MTDPVDSPRAVLSDARFATAPPVTRRGIPDWMLVPIVLLLDLFIATQITPILLRIVAQVLNVLLFSLSRSLYDAFIPFFSTGIFLIGLTITLLFQLALIYGVWLFSRGRRLSTIVIIGILLILESTALRWWSTDQRSTFWLEFAVPLFTATAAAIAYGRAKRTARNSTGV